MVVLNEQGSKVLNAYFEWDKHVKRENICNPFTEKRRLRSEFTETYQDSAGRTIIKINDKTEEQKIKDKELDEYIPLFIAKREIWVGQYILKNYGYNSLINFAQTHSKDETAQSYDREFWKWFESIKPCEGENGKCSIFCPDFNNKANCMF